MPSSIRASGSAESLRSTNYDQRAKVQRLPQITSQPAKVKSQNNITTSNQARLADQPTAGAEFSRSNNNVSSRSIDILV